jgi:hypothetical protein
MRFDSSGGSSRYREVETIRDEDGVIAVITERIDTGHLSFRIQKEYVSNGEVKTTSHYGRRHIDGIVRLAKQAGDRIDVLTDTAKVRRARQGYSSP